MSYLDVGHHLTYFMEGGVDVLTGETHRHSSGCSSLVTDGMWIWRADFAHYLEVYHVPLPTDFLARAGDCDTRCRTWWVPTSRPSSAR
ncbi:hypothetical protein [Streptomyces odonnellii]|uniref:hypothetical protein n=1 Tax=Streptomyces odonnellii TaxID=1417980 RepID=UPI0006261024|nr:hypothetical protein [Streptomyces odonnellii]